MQKVLYNYKPFQNARTGIFRIEAEPASYSLPHGWKREEKEYTIIGEDTTCFITHLKQYQEGTWVGDKVIQKNYILPIGIHKTRLVKWIDGQLLLFSDQD